MPIYYCDGKRLKRTIQASTSWLTKNKEIVNSLNVFPVPDGDTGTNMCLTLYKVLEDLENVNSDYLPQVARIIADSSLWGARGSSGVILSQILRGFADGIDNKPQADSMDIALCLKKSAVRAYSAIDKPAEGTILTLLREIAESAIKLAQSEKDIVRLLRHLLEVGGDTLVRTKDLLPELKRANVIDAGGKGFLFMIEGVLKLIEGSDFERPAIEAVTKPILQIESIEERYCLDFMLLRAAHAPEELKGELETQGKDIVIASSSDITKVHIHTNSPDTVLEIARRYGIVEQIKIDDMEPQIFVGASGRFAPAHIGIIAVVSGDGMCDIFKKLNTDIIVEGGQTMNPSVAELKSAIQELQSRKAILLPNNINIIAAAKRAAELSDKEVYIIPSRTIPEGISALTSFSPEKSMEENIKRMEDSISHVKSGEVTRAVRDAEIGTLKIEVGDYIGIYDHSIKASSKEGAEQALLLLLKAMVDEESPSSGLISIFYNNRWVDVDQLSTRVSSTFPELDVEIYYGGQPHYDYIVSVE